MMKRVDAYMTVARAGLMKLANAEFKSMCELDPQIKQHSVAGGKGLIRAYTPRPSWDYPEALEQLIKEVKEKQKLAQKDGTAVKKTATVDPDKASLFAITLTEKFDK
jgi:hypothetical protein